MKCRHCSAELSHRLVDLDSSPPSNAYLTSDALNDSEPLYPLRVLVCDQCWLVQTEDFVGASELFSGDYAYFSSFSSTWLEHAQRYVADMQKRFDLDSDSLVVEVAANDGYLLQYVKEKGIPCYGIEPTHSTAEAARNKGLSIVEEFFGISLARKLAAEGKQADLIAANNVLAHVPDINDFVSGFTELLKPSGVATFEFPHLLNLLEQTQFDTIYHEHFSYLSLSAVTHIFLDSGLQVFDVEEHPTHGGSLRVFVQRVDTGTHAINHNVAHVLGREAVFGITTTDCYDGFQHKVDTVRDDFKAFLADAKANHKSVAGYGAAAKGNTLLNYAGIGAESMSFVADRNPAKQGQYLPGSHLPIVGEDQLSEHKPDYVVIFPWNLRSEVMNQLEYIREWGGQFVTAVPELQIS